jgi:hypothetical protein
VVLPDAVRGVTALHDATQEFSQMEHQSARSMSPLARLYQRVRDKVAAIAQVSRHNDERFRALVELSPEAILICRQGAVAR